MGQHRFRLPNFWDLERRQVSCIHVVGLDGIPWPCRVDVTDGILTISRSRNESGKVHIPYPFLERGELAVCTGTLPESEKAYDLMTELARGTLNRLRNQLSIWQEGGLNIPDSLKELIEHSIHDLSASIVSDDLATKDNMARTSIETALECIFQLSVTFGEQISAYRVSQKEISPFWLAANIGSRGSAEVVDQSQQFDLLEIKDWQSKEKLENGFFGTNKKLILGPLLDASAGAPTWSGDPSDEFENRKRRILQKCREQLTDLPANTALVHAVSGLNGIGHRHLSFPQQQQLTNELFQVIEEMSIDVPIVASFDFPWAERLAWSVGGMHPLQVADSLLRKALPVSFIGLDINLDYWPAGSVVRDPLQWIDLVDVWAQLGLPLMIFLRTPLLSDLGDTGQVEEKSVNVVRGGMSNGQRLDLVRVVLMMLTARPNVHGCIFRQWSDKDDLRFPGAGLVTADCDSKIILEELDRYHREVLHRN